MWKAKTDSPATQADLAVLEVLPDEDIDTSDIPETTGWSDAVRGKFYRPVKKKNRSD